ncbi:MAG TPA: M28 family peptidase [Phycisphaerae bacterium]|nr:M28 family peptidase [Phycisphaerae bacterium]
MTARRLTVGVAGIVLLSLAPTAGASDVGQVITDQISATSYQDYHSNLLYTHDGDNRDALHGPQHDPARDNILATLQSFGLQAELYPLTYNGVTYYNVMATQLGTNYPDSYYVIGAHYDSVDCPGADDNASGSAGVMEIARVLSGYQSEYTIKYMVFDLEEYGLYGSEAYVADHPTDDIRGMIAMDMIAWDPGPRACDIWGRTSSATIKSHLLQAINLYSHGLAATIQGQRDRSDHASFEAAGYQACHLREDEGNPNYHLPADSVDTPDYINYAFAADMARSIAGYLVDRARIHLPGDCNDNGIPDEEEIAADPSIDCNNNGVIDACELAPIRDCNANGILDDCDIASGYSSDQDGDGIPDECEDVTPPAPDPMTFENPDGSPHAISTTAIAMIATEATDPFGVEYYFFASGAGSHIRNWGPDRNYTDTGLLINRSYSYKVKAHDLSTHHNETGYSPLVTIATFIETPTALTFGTVADTSIQVTAPGTFTRLTANLSGLFFEVTRLDGTPVGGTQANTWVQTQTITATGLSPGTVYRFRVKARNYYGHDETPWYPTSGYINQPTTGGATCSLLGDVNQDGDLNGLDIDGFVRAKLGGAPLPGENQACANYGGSMAEDIAAFAADLLGL